jgi:formylglycine-generating enzyme required for sulfatase activity
LNARARTGIVFFTLAFAAGCSLLVDAGGLSTASEVPDGGGSTDGNGGGPNEGGGGDAGENLDAEAGGPPGPCPAMAGPTMLRVTDGYGTFCIDTTVVTNKQMNVFLASSARPTAPSACSFKTGYGGNARPDDDKPVALVDWCDAWMYCAWAGKRLCGPRDKTKSITALSAQNDPALDEWYAACSRTGSRAYPYGSAFDQNACNGCQRTSQCSDGGAPLLPVGSLTTCNGGYDGIFDISGNASEWEDNCDPSDVCPPRGGNAAMGGASITCAINAVPSISARNAKGDRYGIRCCAD